MEHGSRAGALLTEAIRTVAETGSTNADLAALARDGAAEGTWLRAERQSAGRGREGRPWSSPPGNLYASTLVRLRPSDPPAATLALVAAVALEEAVSTFIPGRVMLKWPNDLLVEGAKLSGILLERADDAVIVGTGVNVTHHPDLRDRPTVSLSALGMAPHPATLLEVFADSFARWLGRWRSEGMPPVRERWLRLAHPIGSPLIARLPDGRTMEGLFDGLDIDGALNLRLASGERHVIHAGDVFVLQEC